MPGIHPLLRAFVGGGRRCIALRPGRFPACGLRVPIFRVASCPPFTFSSRVLFVLHHGVISPLWFVALSLCSGMLLHKKQMPFMVGKGACPFALSRPLVWRSSERSENLDRTSGRIRRRV